MNIKIGKASFFIVTACLFTFVGQTAPPPRLPQLTNSSQVAETATNHAAGLRPRATQTTSSKAGFSALRPIGDWTVDPEDASRLRNIFAQVAAAANSITPGPDASAQRRAVDNELCSELENFLASRTNSAYGPSVRLSLARSAWIRSSYARAMEHYDRAWLGVRGSADSTAQQMAREATGGLARLLAITGRMDELDALERDVRQLVPDGTSGKEWHWAMEMRTWARKYPAEAYKCGLYCLDQLGRLTQPGQYRPKDITEAESSTNGFSAAELIRIGTAVGLRISTAQIVDLTNLPVPSIVHLRSQHFIVVREKRGAFYNVYDTVAGSPKWLLAGELADEATGCVLVSDAIPPVAQKTAMDAITAATFRGRCHGPLPWDHDDSPCQCPPGPCPPGSDGGNGNGSDSGNLTGNTHIGGKHGNGSQVTGVTGGGQQPCRKCGESGMPTVGAAGSPAYFISQPYLNLWLEDVPLDYKTGGFGPNISLRIAYNFRRWESEVSGQTWQGTMVGDAWSCSWLSFAELDSSKDKVDLMLPGGGWATFNFQSGSSLSDVNYRHNLALEKVGTPTVTSLVLRYPDGAQTTYGLVDTSDTSFSGLYYMTSSADPSGKSTTYSYDSNFYLTGVTAADGTTFTVSPDSWYANAIGSVTASYGASVTFTYASYFELVGITDAAGISSQIAYDSGSSLAANAIVTCYGTTSFSSKGNAGDYGIFDRTIEITNALGMKEFYAMMNSYPGNDWPAFANGQIPSSTPIGTLDTTERSERNTFYWNAQQFAPFVGTSFHSFTWDILKKAHILHWLGGTDPTYTHWNSLSLDQQPSADGTTEGAILWYDYKDKPPNTTYEVGTQILPSVIARVMPDTTTWYQYFERNTNGLPTLAAEKWVEAGSDRFRTNTFLYAANNVDVVAWTNALGVRASSNVFNARHQVTTNYDALGQASVYTFDGTTFQVTSVARPTGLTTIYSYDANYRLTNVADVQITRTNSYTWGADGNVKTHTDERGLKTTNFWDGLNRLTGTSDGRGATTNLFYRLDSTPYANGNGDINILDVTASKDRMGFWTYYDYDALRRPTAITNANNVVTRYGYCDCGAITSMTNAFGSAIAEPTLYVNDYQGHRTQTTLPDGTVVNYTQDLLGRLTVTSDGWGSITNTLDNLGRQVAVSNAVGRVQFVIYDPLDRATNSTDQNGVLITNSYDNLNRVLIRGQPDGGTEKFGYSARGLTAFTNSVSTNFYVYDEGSRKTFETNANNELIQFQYDSSGNLTNLIDGKAQSTKWAYNQYNLVTNKLDQAGVEILRYKYDADDRLTNRWSKAKLDTYYAYDSVGNLTNIDYNASTDVKFQYDGLNRLTNMVDASGTNKYTYLAGGLLYTEGGHWTNDVVTNTYLNGLRTNLSLQQPTGAWTNKFAYDAAKRLTNVTSQAGSFTNEYFAGVGGASGYSSRLIKRLLLPNTSIITNDYDSTGRQLGTWLRNSSGTEIDSAKYGYNTANQRTAFTNAAGTYYQYTYDNIGQLKIADSSVNSEDRGYKYDSAWNVQYRTNNGVLGTFTVNSKNQLTVPPSGTSDSYDDNGNLTARGFTAHTTRYLTYDDENRLVQIEHDFFSVAQWKTTFTYDGLGRLRRKIEYDSGGTNVLSDTRYIYDGMRVIQERNSGNTPTVSYTRGNDLSGSLEWAGGIGGLLARSYGYSSGNWSTHSFYHADGNGNITYLEDSSQALAASYRYDPFGNTISSSGTLATTNIYRFSSKEVHANSGMYYYGYRFYDPDSQRWINRDPVPRRDPNLYVALANSPTIWVDPDGGQVRRFPLFPLLPPAAPTPKPPLPIGPIGDALFAGWLCAKAIDIASIMIWPEPSPDPLPLLPRPPKATPKVCVYHCPSGYTIEIKWDRDDGRGCPPSKDIDGEICQLVPNTTPGPPPRR